MLIDVIVQDVFEILMRMVGYFYKVFDEYLIIVVVDILQNCCNYEDFIIQIFFFFNLDVKDVMMML